MLLTINLGNTNASFALFDGRKRVRSGRVSLRDLHLLPNEIGDALVRRIAMASVAPSREDQIVALLATHYSLPVLLAGRDLPYGIDIQADDPSSVGADRVLNAIAAYARVKSACIVADAGTAVTVDLVSERGSFCGGAIAPGPDMMLQAMHRQTELLPEVSFAPATDPIGHDTASAMRSGAYWGAIGLVERLASEIAAAHGRRNVPLLVTGGRGEFLAKALKRQAEYVPELTHEGMAIIAQR